VHYYTGNGHIDGLEKSTWSRKDDGKGSKPYHIYNIEDIGKALIFAEAAYQVTETESSKNNYQYEFWNGLKTFMEESNSIVNIRRPLPKNWTDISIGKSDIYIAAGFNTKTRVLMIWLIMRGENAKRNFDTLYQRFYNESLLNISSELKWERRDHSQRSAVILERSADIFDMNARGEQYKFYKENLERFVVFFKHAIQQLY
jgi:hypothetical protein